jgi:hypothetical protein
MPFDMPAYLERLRTFLPNRANFPVEELEKYAGLWVAFSPDGTRVVASAYDPADLESLVRAAGLDPMHCVIEGIPGDDGWFGKAGGCVA